MDNKFTDFIKLGKKQQEGNLVRKELTQFIPHLKKLEDVLAIPESYELHEVQTDIR